MRLPWIEKKKKEKKEKESRLIFRGHICWKYPPAIKRPETCVVVKGQSRKSRFDGSIRRGERKNKPDRSFGHNEDYLERCSSDATKG